MAALPAPCFSHEQLIVRDIPNSTHFPHTFLKRFHLPRDGRVSLLIDLLLLARVLVSHGRSPLVVSVRWQEMEP